MLLFLKNHMVINVMVILPSGERPIVEGSAISGVKPGLIGRPEPSVDFLGEEVGTIATIKVAQTARCPDVLHAYESRRSRKSVAAAAVVLGSFLANNHFGTLSPN